jgi:hypothetical protein
MGMNKEREINILFGGKDTFLGLLFLGASSSSSLESLSSSFSRR